MGRNCGYLGSMGAVSAGLGTVWENLTLGILMANLSSEMLGGAQLQESKDKARSPLTKIVNALTAKLEIGGPMAFLYLLGNPDCCILLEELCYRSFETR